MHQIHTFILFALFSFVTYSDSSTHLAQEEDHDDEHTLADYYENQRVLEEIDNTIRREAVAGPRRRKASGKQTGKKNVKLNKKDGAEASQIMSKLRNMEMDSELKNAKYDLSAISARGNHIYFYASVSKSAIYRMNELIEGLHDAFRAAKWRNPEMLVTTQPIYLHINSPGGAINAGFAGADMIKQSEHPVYTILEGATASAATLLSVAGAKRYIRPNAMMIVNQLDTWLAGKYSAIEDSFENDAVLMTRMKEFYKQYSHGLVTNDTVVKFLENDRYFNPKRCIELGLVDEIWEGQKSVIFLKDGHQGSARGKVTASVMNAMKANGKKEATEQDASPMAEPATQGNATSADATESDDAQAAHATLPETLKKGDKKRHGESSSILDSKGSIE